MLAALLAVLAAAGCTSVAPARAGARASASPVGYRVLVFSRTAGFRHASIPAGIRAVRQLGRDNGFVVDATEDPAVFNLAGLDRYRVVMFLNTTGDVLDDAQQTAFEAYIRGGHGFVGVHSAADTEYGWPFYGGLVGAYFAGHPAVQRATVHLAGGRTVSRVDEWYNFRTRPPADAQVVSTVDESTYTGGTMGADHPITWYRPYQGGRSFYTAQGHTTGSYTEPDFLATLLSGIRYAAGGALP
ncbi:MAG: ThuA domain-containing protein [Micromonosporaceae bacterium]|nr:ThuA domain-containing protein [Micromonosporaceae bacterium]